MGKLATPVSVQELQTALHAKAKAQPEFRFYALYAKVWRTDILDYAYRCCRANKGAAGVDEQEFADVEAYGAERWLGELAQALKEQKHTSARRARRKPARRTTGCCQRRCTKGCTACCSTV